MQSIVFGLEFAMLTNKDHIVLSCALDIVEIESVAEMAEAI